MTENEVPLCVFWNQTRSSCNSSSSSSKECDTSHAEAKDIGHFGQPEDVSLAVTTPLTQCALVIT